MVLITLFNYNIGKKKLHESNILQNGILLNCQSRQSNEHLCYMCFPPWFKVILFSGLLHMLRSF